MVSNLQQIIVFFVTALALLSGCQAGSGTRMLAELGFDSRTSADMTPLLRTMACIVATDARSSATFELAYAEVETALQRSLPEADWSDLVCLSFSDQVQTGQVKKTLAVLKQIIGAVPEDTQALRGIIRLLEQRLAQLEWKKAATEQWRTELAEQQRRSERRVNDLQDRLVQQRQYVSEQQERIQELEEQVRKLKEVELMLQPDPSEPR